MIGNYFKIAWRTIARDKTYSAVNIAGLTIGLCASLLVGTVVMDELSYDRFWSRSDDLYKVITSSEMGDGAYTRFPASPVGLGYALKENFPEMEEFSAISPNQVRFRIEKDDPDGIAVDLVVADTNAVKLLDLKAVSGQLAPFVAGHRNLLITERLRDKHFKGENPVGKIIQDISSWSDEPQLYIITAVIRDIPSNTHLRTEAIVLEKPDDDLVGLSKQGLGGLRSFYYLLKPGTDPAAFTVKINTWFQNFMEEPGFSKYRFDLQPITEIYLQSGSQDGLMTKGNIRTVYILIGVGSMLLLIACINFVNLSLARVIKRLKETGVRKVLGAQRRQLIIQFVAESVLYFAISAGFAIGLYGLAIPVVESFLRHALANTLLTNFTAFIFTLVLILVISALTGAYPAWLLSGLKPANTLRGKLGQSLVLNTGSLRNALVVTQFAISVIALVALGVVRSQLRYLDSKDIGYQKDNLLHIDRHSWEGKGQTFKTELKKMPGISAGSIAGWNPADGRTSSFNFGVEDPFQEGRKISAYFIEADFDFVQTMGFELLDGRDLDATRGTDVYNSGSVSEMNKKELENYQNSRSSLVTASTAKQLGISELGVPVPKLGFPAVGILKDFHRESLHHALGPVFILGKDNPDYAGMFIRTLSGMEKQAQESLVQLWKTFYPDRPLKAQWVTDILNKQYEAEQRQQALFSFFGGLMLFLSAMGIFGLIVHATGQRIKEIGIRKVLGASVVSIVRLFSAGYVKLVCLAILVASPVAWWLMSKWLENFAYRIKIQWWMFAGAGLAAVTIALLTVSWQAIRSAVANPVETLRNE